jgi:alanine racemase
MNLPIESPTDAKPESPHATLRLGIDTDSLASNWGIFNDWSGKAPAGAAVKANCYGLGVDACVPTLRDAGCRQFFVAHWSEVEAVARHVPPEQIAVLHGPTTRSDAEYARAMGVIPVINSAYQAYHWVTSGGGPCHVMVDTGMNRLGFTLEGLRNPIVRSLEIDLLMSHLACADEDSPMNARQLADLRHAAQSVSHKRLSIANSAGVVLGDEYALDLTRPGIGLYGGVPRAELRGAIMQVAFIEAAIIQCRTLKEGDTVGYNAAFTATRPMRVGTVSLGYADGFLRSWGEIGALTYYEKRFPILGRISMDMLVVDLSEEAHLDEGDWLGVSYDLPKIAQQSPLSQYELLTVLGNRLR